MPAKMQLYQNKNKKSLAKYITRLFRYCYRHRSDWIRTSGLLVPNQALYQTEPHPVFSCFRIIPHMRHIVNIFFAIALFFLLTELRGRTVPFCRPSEQASSLFPHRQRSDVFIFPIGRQARSLFHAMISLEHLGSICEYQLFQIKSCEMGK